MPTEVDTARLTHRTKQEVRNLNQVKEVQKLRGYLKAWCSQRPKAFDLKTKEANLEVGWADPSSLCRRRRFYVPRRLQFGAEAKEFKLPS